MKCQSFMYCFNHHVISCLHIWLNFFAVTIPVLVSVKELPFQCVLFFTHFCSFLHFSFQVALFFRCFSHFFFAAIFNACSYGVTLSFIITFNQCLLLLFFSYICIFIFVHLYFTVYCLMFLIYLVYIVFYCSCILLPLLYYVYYWHFMFTYANFQVYQYLFYAALIFISPRSASLSLISSQESYTCSVSCHRILITFLSITTVHVFNLIFFSVFLLKSKCSFALPEPPCQFPAAVYQFQL